jgi:enoyl-CoA hydratase/carnithine racemase
MKQIKRSSEGTRGARAMFVELTEAVTDASWDDAVAVIVITGAGDRAFCAGGDVREYAGHYTRKPRDYWKSAAAASRWSRAEGWRDSRAGRQVERWTPCGEPLVSG